MELLFATVIGACIGALLRYTLPERRTYGALLLPAVGAVATAIVWVGLVWIGWTFDGTWIWVASLGAGALAPLAAAIVLPRRRMSDDARRIAELSRG